MGAYRVGDSVFLPLGELSRQLSIAVEVQGDTGDATGFIVRENRKFHLNLSKATVTIAGKTDSFDPSLVRLKEGELFVEKTLYEKWLPVTLEADLPSLFLKVKPKEPLPIQRKLKRQKKLGPSENPDLNFQNLDIPYEMYERPVFDQVIETTFSKSRSGATDASTRLTTQFAGDLLGLQTHVILTGNSKTGLDSTRYTLGREDPDGRLLGPLGARTFSLGNVGMPSVNYISRPTTLGQGALVSNRPLSRPSRYDTQTFSGVLLPGWDVELYQNGVLVNHQSSNENSSYEFSDLPLYFGTNDFRLVFHGPLGEVREERHRFMLEDSMVLPGEIYYTAGAVQFDDGSERSVVQIEKSLFRRLSVTVGGIHNVKAEDSLINTYPESQSYSSLGLRSYLNSVFLSTDYVASNLGGSLGALGVKSGFWGSTVTLSHAVLQDFTSDEFIELADPYASKSRLRFDTYMPALRNFPISLESSRSQFVSGKANDEHSLRVAGHGFGVSFSHRWRFLRSSAFDTTNGELQVSSNLRWINLRGSYSYEISPEAQGTSVDLNANSRIWKGYNLVQSLTNQLKTNETRYEIGLNRGTGPWGFGVRAGVSNRGEHLVGARLNMSLGIEPRRSEVVTSAQSMVTSGSASVHTFVDTNLNGVQDPGEPPLPGVGFMVDGGMDPMRTNEDGYGFLKHLPTGQRVNLAINRGTVEDPQLTPVKRGFRLHPRAGKIAKLEFPFIMTTEIDGFAKIDRGSGVKPAADLEIELVDSSDPDHVVSRTRSAHDGYYILADIPPGDYVLRVSPEQAKRLRVVMSELQNVRILPNSNFINGIELLVKVPSVKADEMPQVDKSAVVSPASAPPDREMHFIILGTFALESSYSPIVAQMQKLEVPIVKRDFRRSMKLHYVQVVQDSKEKAEEATLILEKYKYKFTSMQFGEKTKILIGPYYTKEDAVKERAVIAAALTGHLIQMTESNESIEMTEVAIGGFAKKEQAEKVASDMKKLNFTEIRLQKRAPKEWKPIVPAVEKTEAPVQPPSPPPAAEGAVSSPPAEGAATPSEAPIEP